MFEHGEAFRSRYFLALVKRADSLKVGFTTGKGLNAVKRNRLKRILRELWRNSGFASISEIHIVLMIKREAEGVGFQLLKSNFDELMQRVERQMDERSREALGPGLQDQ